MKNKKELTKDEIIAKIYATSFKYVHDSTLSFIKFYDSKYKRIQRQIIDHEENEP